MTIEHKELDHTLLSDAEFIASTYNVCVPDSTRIAGGCLRDLYFGKPVKDVDILVEWHDHRDYQEAYILADKLGYTGRTRPTYEQNTNANLRAVFTLNKEGKLPIDIIFINCPVQEWIEQFPVNASMIWLEGNRLVTHKKFDEFCDTGKLEFTDTASEEYIKRITAKGY